MAPSEPFKMLALQQLPAPHLLCFPWCHIHKPFDPRCVCPLIFLSEPDLGALPIIASVSLMHIPSLFTCFYVSGSGVCVFFSICQSICVARAACFEFYFIFIPTFCFLSSFSTNLTDTYITVPINVHIALNYIFPARVCVVCVWFLFLSFCVCVLSVLRVLCSVPYSQQLFFSSSICTYITVPIHLHIALPMPIFLST